MILCPTCGLEWTAGTQTCPKDGTRLTQRVGARETVALTEQGVSTWKQQRPSAQQELEQTLTTHPRPSAARKALAPELPPEPRSGKNKALVPAASPSKPEPPS